MRCFFTFLVLISINTFTFADEGTTTKSTSEWTGTFTYTESGINANKTRTYASVYCLDIMDKNGNLIADAYTFDAGNIPYEKQIYSINQQEGSIKLTYVKCESLELGKKCTDKQNPGTLMLKLSKIKKTKSKLKPTWYALEPFKYSKKYKLENFEIDNVVCAEGGAVKN